MTEIEKENGSIAYAEDALAAHPSDSKNKPIELERELEEFENRDMDFRTIMAIIALACGYEAALLSFILPANIIFAINADIGPSSQANWIAGAWTVAAAVVQTITGRCSDVFGRRYLMIAGNVFGFVGCTISARASSMDTAIAGCTLMGVGAGIQQLAYACVNEVVPKKARGRTIGLFNTSAIPGSLFGSAIAYAMIAHATWRWAFYLGMIFNGIAIVMVSIFYWPPGFLGLHPEGKTPFQQFKELDFLGLFLFGGGLTTFLIGLSFGNNPYPWSSAQVLAPLLIGAILLCIVFPLWEVYCPMWITKLCPPSIFKNGRGFTIPLVTIFVSGMLYYSLSALWPQQIQLLFTTVPETVGWYGMALGGGATFGGITCGILFAKIRRTRWQFLISIIVQTIFIGLMATVDQNSAAKAIAFVICTGIGIGFCQTIGILVIQLGVRNDQIGVATGLTGTTRTTGGAIAIAIYGAIINQKVASNIGPRVATAAIGAGLDPSQIVSFITALTSGSADALKTVAGITPTIIAAGAGALTSVYSDAFSLVYLVSLAFGGMAITAAFFVRSVDHLLTQEIAVRLDKPHILGRGDGEAAVLGKEVV